jgi:nucleoside-diphosphate-sugar epimerase
VIVGGAGFIGHHLALRLQEIGAEPHILDSLQVNNLGAFSAPLGDERNIRYVDFIHERLDLLRTHAVPLHVADARDYSGLVRAFNGISPDVVVHLAAVAHANRSNKDPFSTFDHNSRTLENALDASRGEDVQFIYFSSSMVYGDFGASEVNEDDRCEPIGIYGALKYGGEKLVIAYQQVFGLTFTIIRPSALYGERCVSRRVGQAFIENALDGVPLVVDGDGSDALDFTYIQDLVDGVICCMGNEQAHNEVFNMTFGESRTLREMVGILKEQIPDVEVEYQARDSLMPKRGTLSVAKAKELIGYKPSWPLESGLVRYLDWYRGRLSVNG